jgi:double zinc ribbon protein
MMTHDLGDIDSGNQFFACGHENPAGNRYCDACGADRGRRCPLCSSLNRGQAKFCRACGARLLDEGTAPKTRETTVASPTLSRSRDPVAPGTPRTTVPAAKERPNLLGSGTRFLADPQFVGSEKPRWSSRGGLRGQDPFSSLDHDVTVEDEWPARDRRRKVFLPAVAAAVVVAVAIAVALGVEQFGPTRHGGFLDRARGWLVADRDSASATRGEQPAAPKGADSSAASSARESETTAPRAATSEPAQAAAPAAAPRAAEVPATSPSLPSRSPGERSAASGDELPSRETPQALVPAPETSEERMADFLIEQLGPEPAAEKALSTAAWYDADRAEYAYWQRVAAAIRRRAGS